MKRSLAIWMYRHALRWYPREFRRGYEAEMLADFAAEWRRAADGGWTGKGVAAARMALDLATSLISAWIHALPWTIGLEALSALVLVTLGMRGWDAELVWAAAVGVATAAVGLGAIVWCRHYPWVVIPVVAVLGLLVGFLLGPHLRLERPAAPAPTTPAAYGLLPLRDARAIYDRTRAAYAHAASYADQGVVRQEWRTNWGRRRDNADFNTTYVRGGSFAFEYRYRFQALAESQRYMVWSDGTSTKTAWSIPARSPPRDLNSALAAASGISQEASNLVPSLLIPGVGSWLVNPAKISFAGAGSIAGRAAYQLSIENRGSSPRQLWVDAATFQILRIGFRTVLDRTTSVETTIVYDGHLDQPIAPGAFDFRSAAPLTFWQMASSGTNRILFLFGGISVSTALWMAIKRERAGQGFMPRRRPFRGWRSGAVYLPGFLVIAALSFGFALAQVSTDVALNNFLVAVFALNMVAPFLLGKQDSNVVECGPTG